MLKNGHDNNKLYSVILWNGQMNHHLSTFLDELKNAFEMIRLSRLLNIYIQGLIYIV